MIVMDLSLERIAEICRRYHVREPAVFGSPVRGVLRADSDIDLLVDLEPDLNVDYFDI